MTQFSETVDIKRPPEEVRLCSSRPSKGKTFARTGRYSLLSSSRRSVPSGDGLIVFKGLGELAAPIASRDVRNRWTTSLERLTAAVEAGD